MMPPRGKAYLLIPLKEYFSDKATSASFLNTGWRKGLKQQRENTPTSWEATLLLETQYQCGKASRRLSTTMWETNYMNHCQHINNLLYMSFRVDLKMQLTHSCPPPQFCLSFHININKQDVYKLFKTQKLRKSPGPDLVSPSTLKQCCGQLAPVFTDIFNKWLQICSVSTCF